MLSEQYSVYAMATAAAAGNSAVCRLSGAVSRLSGAVCIQLGKPLQLESFIRLSKTPQFHSQVGDEMRDSIEEEEEQGAVLNQLRKGKTEEAWRRLQKWKAKKAMMGMRHMGRECISRLVAQLCLQGTSSSVKKAQELIEELEKNREMDLLDCDSMGLIVMASSRMGAGHYALHMLRTMIHERGMRPRVKIWSAVVSRLSKNDEDAKLALEIFDEVCNALPLPKSEEFEGMYPDSGAFNAALNACASAGAFERARSIWKEDMQRFDVAPDVLSFNVLIKVFARGQRLDLVESLLREMESKGVSPNLATFNSFVATFVGAGELDRAERVLCTLRDEVRKASQDDDPFLHDLEKYRGRFSPDVRMFTTIMKGYVQQGRNSEALQLLLAMQAQSSNSSLNFSIPSSSKGSASTSDHIPAISSNLNPNGKNSAVAAPNEYTFNMAIRACTKMGLMNEARAILGEMVRVGIPANNVAYNTLLQGLCSIPDMDAAAGLLEDMKAAGVPADVVTFNTLIAGHLRSRNTNKAMETFGGMREHHISPSRVTYGTLMSAFSKAGHPEFAARVFGEMASDSRVGLDAVACNILIDAYARAGMEDDALRSFADMKSRGFSPCSATYCTLVRAYTRSKNYGEILLLWKEIMERSMGDDTLRLRPDEALLDSLIDAFVRGAYFQKALQVVECMERQGIEATRARAKYKRLYVELYAKLFTSPYRSQSRSARTAVRRRAVEAFKFWVGLPNTLYAGDWRLNIQQENDDETAQWR